MKAYADSHLTALYLRAAGTSEIPTAYHLWTCLALTSAAVGDRVALEVIRWQRLVPNLYIFLLGPSGLGKGLAFGLAQRFERAMPRVPFHPGPITAAALITQLAKSGAKAGTVGPSAGKLFLLQEELAMSVGEGPLARDFIKALTGLYNPGSPDSALRKRTNTDGDVVVRNHCLTFLGGSTREWFIESVPRNAIEGGFLGRCAVVAADYNLERRIPRPTFPPDYEAIVTHIGERLGRLGEWVGTVTMGGDFETRFDEWYRLRPVPTDPGMMPTWAREPMLRLKLATVLLLGEPLQADGAPPTVLQAHHWDKASALTYEAQRAVPSLIAYASQTPDGALLSKTRGAIERAGTIPHFILQRNLSGTGIDKKRLAVHIATLVDEGRIGVERTARGYTYHWKRRGRVDTSEVPPTVGEDEGGDDE